MGRKSRTPVPTPKRMSAPALQHQDPPGTQYRCTCCGTYYTTQRGNFLASYSRLFAGWGGYFPVCKVCLTKYYEWLLADIYDGEESKAIRRMTQLIDIPYDTNLLQRAFGNAGDAPFSLVSSYYQRLGSTNYKKNGATYIDTILDDMDQKERDAAALEQWQQEFKQYAIEEAQAACRSEIDALRAELERYRAGGFELEDADITLEEQDDGVISEEITHRWGSGFKNEEYEYLEAQYEDWLDCYACDTKIQEELFKNICLAQLNINKAQHSEGGDIAKATKAFNDLVLMANIAPKQQKNLLTDADTFGTLIERWEKDEPIPEPDPVWEDVDGIKRNISTWFFGHLCKMFKIENDWAQMYEDEIAPYTAHPPAYQGDFDLVEDGDVYEQEAGL